MYDVMPPIPGLILHTNGMAKTFGGSVALQAYDTADGLLQLFCHDFPTKLDLNKENVEEAHWMIIVVEGELNLYVRDREFKIIKGGSCVFHTKDYRIKTRGLRVKYLVYNLEPIIERNELCLDEFSLGGYMFTSEMQVMVAEILRAPKSVPRPTQWLSDRLWKLLQGLLEKCRLAKESAYEPDRMLGLAFAAHKFIHENYLQNFTIIEKAKILGTNECSLKEAYKTHFGIGMAKTTNSLRIEVAMKLLLYTNLTVLDIAIRSGFASDGTLRENLFSITKMKPEEFRQKSKL